jgi:hypothetical protein
MSIFKDGICIICGKNFNSAINIIGRSPEAETLVEKVHAEKHLRQYFWEQEAIEEEERHL